MTDFSQYVLYYTQFMNVQMRQKVNGLLYYVRKLPLIGKKIPVSIYQSYGIKQAIFILGVIANVVRRIVAKFLWLFFYMVIGKLLAPIVHFKESSVLLGVFIWLVVVVYLFNFFEGYSQSYTESERNYTESFQLSGPIFLRAKMYLETIQHALSYVPAAIVVGFMAHRPLVVPIVIVMSYIGGYFLANGLGRLMFNVPTFAKIILGLLYACGTISVTFFLIYKDIFHGILSILFSGWGALLSLILALICWRLLQRAKNETRYLQWLTQKDTVSISKTDSTAKQDYLAEGLQMKDKITLTTVKTNYSGEKYLNSLLFSRYKRELKKQLLLRIIGIALAGLVSLLLIYFVGNRDGFEEALYKAMPWLFFMMYMIGFGRKMVQTAFINCDAAMLYYPFYRESTSIVRGFMYRLWKTMQYNGMITITIFGVFSMMGILYPGTLHLKFYVALFLSLVSLTLLFSFHEWFVYYLLQPFTSDLQVVNPVYKVVSAAMYWVSYLNLRMDIGGIPYVGILTVISFAYVVIGLLVIVKVAPKTFRMKG